MTTSRRNLIQALAAGGVALAAGAGAATVAAEENRPVPPASVPGASAEEHELKIVNIELLEDEARRILPPGRFAVMGPAGDGWTYRENRRAFNDFPIMPRRLHGVDDKDIVVRTTLLGLDLSTSMPNCPTPRAPAWRGRCLSRRALRPGRWKKSPRRRRARSGFRST
jgi:L-lactate oxidase